MPWTMAQAEGDQILVMGYHGKITSEELQEAHHHALGRLTEQKIARVMVDCSTAQAEMPMIDVYKLPDLYVAEDVSRMIRIAMILPQDGYKRDVYEFYEDVCRNRGFQVQLFDDGDAAWTWLRGDAGISPAAR